MRFPYHVNLRGSPAAASIERLARWWTSATKAERFALLQRTLNGEHGAPTLETLQLAAFIAEAEAGEVEEGQ